MPIIVGRPINGISINGLEFLLNEDDSRMQFESIDSAEQFLLQHNFEQNVIDEIIVFQEV